MAKEKYQVETEDGSVYEIETDDAPAAQQATQQPTVAEQPALSRFFSALGEMVNPIPAVQEYLNRPNQWKAAMDVMGTKRGSPEEAAALERGMQIPLSQPTNMSLPPGMEPLGPAIQETMSGNLAGAAGTLTGAYGVPWAVSKGIAAGTGLLRNRNPMTAEALDYVQQQGVPVTAGPASGNLMVQGADWLAAGSPIGSVIAGAAKRKTAEGMQRLSGELAEQVHPTPVLAEGAGAGMMGYLERSAAESRALADTRYQTAWDTAADPKYTRQVQIRWKRDPKTGRSEPVYEEQEMPVDIRSVKAQLQPIWSEMQQWWPAAERSASAGYQAVKTIMGERMHVPVKIAERGLSGLKEISREGPEASKGLVKFIIPKLEGMIDTAMGQAGPEAIEALQGGRRATAIQKATEAVRKSIAGNLEEPVQAFEKMTARKDTAIERLRDLAREAPGELPKVGRAVLEELIDKATNEGGFGRAKGIYNDWRKLGPETKQILYPNPRHRQDLDNFFLAAKQIADNPNPSGTAIVGQLIPQGVQLARGDVMGPLVYTLGSGVVSALLHTPMGVKLLTQSLKIPVNHPAAASLMGQMRQMADEERIQEYLKSKGKTMLPYTYASQANQ